MDEFPKIFTVDGGVFLGQDPKSSLSACAEDIVKIMDNNNIDMAIAASLRSVFGSQAEGNREILDSLKGFRQRLMPMAALSPLSFVAGKGTVKSLAKEGFKIIGAFPFYQSWPAGIRVFRKMAEEISEAGLALQVAVGNWEGLTAVACCLGGMDMPVLIRWVRGGGYLYLTEEIALAHEYGNLYFDVGNMTTVGGIAKLCSEIGADRLYISSNMPLVYERSVYYRVYAEELSFEERKKVCGVTLSKILNL
ncbi:MAG: hypothetical protein JW734_08895 [Candidatus Omnitrophica bacterium]|nr:hypothetical protein [Candidatus Omnitrophota bacterium]